MRGVIRLVGNGGYATIQAAIDASNDGDTILVASGTWTENLNVNKDVTIQGANNHGIAGTAARGAETVIDGQIVINAAGATIDGFKLVGAAAGSLGNTAVEVKANNFSLLNSVLDGTGDIAIIVGRVDRPRHRPQPDQRLFDRGLCRRRQHHRLDPRQPLPGRRRPGHRPRQRRQFARARTSPSPTTSSTASMRGSLNIFPFGPDSVDLNSYIIGNTITNSGVARPVQILPTNLTHNIIGTDFNEAFDGETAAGTTASPARSASTAAAATTTPGAASRATRSPAAPATTSCSAMAATTS